MLFFIILILVIAVFYFRHLAGKIAAQNELLDYFDKRIGRLESRQTRDESSHEAHPLAAVALSRRLSPLSAQEQVIPPQSSSTDETVPEQIAPITEESPEQPAQTPEETQESEIMIPKQSAVAFERAKASRTVSPPEPGFVDQLVAQVRSNERLKSLFSSENLVVKIGISLLILGVVFLLRFAADRGYFPVEFRLAGIGVFAAAILGVGWRLRFKRRGFSLALQAAGIAIFYLNAFAAFRLFGVVDQPAALVIMVLAVLCSVVLAVAQNSVSLAFIGFSGGFMAPVLLSTGSDDHEALFSYFAILNIGVFLVAWFKSWRSLNALGFFFTFGVGSLWGINSYEPENFCTTEPFLLFYFVLYAVVSVLFASRQKPDLKGLVNGSLVFGTPLVVASLQYGLVHEFEYGMAFSSLGFAFFYLSVAYLIWNRMSQNYRDLRECFLAIGVIFVTLTIPLAFEGGLFTSLWALEGAGLVWVGARQNRALSRYFGAGLILLSGLSLFWDSAESGTGMIPILNGEFSKWFFKSVAGGFAGWVLWKHVSEKRALRPVVSETEEEVVEKLLARTLAVLGLLFWYWAFFGDVVRWSSGGVELAYEVSFGKFESYAVILSLLVSLAMVHFWHAKTRWSLIRRAGLGLAVVSPLILKRSLDMEPTWLPLCWSLVLLYATWVAWREKNRSHEIVFLGLGFAAVASLLSLGAGISDAGMLSIEHFYHLLAPASLCLFVAAFLMWACHGEKGWIRGQLRLAFFLAVFLQWTCLQYFKLDLVLPDFFIVNTWPLFGCVALAGLGSLYLVNLKTGWGDVLALHHVWIVAASVFNLIWMMEERAIPFHNYPTVSFLSGGGWIFLLLHFLYLPTFLWSGDRRGVLSTGRALSLSHLSLFFSLAAFFAFELGWQADRFVMASPVWRDIFYALVPTTFLLLVSRHQESRFWPMSRHGELYVNRGGGILVGFMLLWIFLINIIRSGDVSPLPYVPVLNPLDLAVIYAFAAILYWKTMREKTHGSLQHVFQFNLGLSLMAFFWVNAILLRTLNQFAHIPYTWNDLYDSQLVQMALSIYWTVLALGIMVFSTRRAWRSVWMGGGVLLGLIVLKLIFIDFWNSGSLERIIATLIVGILFLIIGYYSPIPARKKGEEA